MLKVVAVAWLLLFFGDLLSTFCYHIPEHVFGSLHVKTHHSAMKDFRHYAILKFNHQVLWDGFLGAVPYLLLAPFFWFFSPFGVICGLVFGQFHVWWRHTTIMGWQTPKRIVFFCQILSITTPEQHWIHHEKTNIGYGDIFTFFDQPGRLWLHWLQMFRIYVQPK